MTTYVFTGIYYRFNEDDSTAEVRPATTTVSFAPGVTTFSYSYDGPQVPGEVTVAQVNGEGTQVYTNYFDNFVFIDDEDFSVIELKWDDNGVEKTTYIMNFDILTGLGGEYTFVLGGAALPTFDSTSDFDDFNLDIISATDVPPGNPFAAGQNIPLATIPGIQITEDDFIQGNEDPNTLLGGVGNDTILGEDGNDFINPGDNDGGGDFFRTGFGNDTVDFADVVNGYVSTDFFFLDGIGESINATLNGVTNTGTVTKGSAGTDTYLDIANPFDAGFSTGGFGIGGTGNGDVFDITTDTDQWMQVNWSFGNDTITASGDGVVRGNYAGGGAIVADLAAGTVSANGFTDTVSGLWEIRASDFADDITGSAADESFILQQGNDTLDGGAGFDRLRYDRGGVESGIKVDWTAGTVTGSWSGQNFPEDFQHNFTGIEWIRGSQFNDVMVGDAGRQVLSGEGGNDTLTGGAGADKFSIGNNSSRGDGGGIDVITDFEIGTDVLDFDGVDMTNAKISAAFADAVDTGNGAAVFLDETAVLFQNLSAAQVATIDPFATTTNDGSFGPGGGGGGGGATTGVRLDAGPAGELLTGSEGNDFLNGNSGDDTLLGLGGNDDLYGSAGDDFINPGDNEGGLFGYDWVVTDQGNDTVDMSDVVTGWVGLSYFGSAPAILATINGATNTGSVDKGASGTDVLIDVAKPMDTGADAGGLAIMGTDGDDVYNVTTEADQWTAVRSYAGNDTINISGDGEVRIEYQTGGPITADLTLGVVQQDGFTDTINGNAWEVRASDGNDSILGSAADESFIGRAGTDTIDGGGGFDRIRYDRTPVEGPVTINFATGTATGTFGGQGFTHLISNIEWARGSFNDDILIGDGNAQRLEGNAGNDTMTGGAGADTFMLGSPSWTGFNGGTDTISDFEIGVDMMNVDNIDATDAQIAQAFALAADTANGAFVAFADGSAVFFEGLTATQASTLSPVAATPTEGDDMLFGTAGSDVINGLGGNDSIRAGDGADTIVGGVGDDTIIGGDTEADLRDVVFAGDGDDMVDGGYGNDDLNGMGGNDTMEGGFGVDRLVGGDGDDVLTGSAFSDQIFGNDGFDFINGGFGSDRVNGGAGADRFFHIGSAGHGSDWIQDYSAAEGDVLVYGGAAGPANFQVNITNTAGAGDAGVDEAFVIWKPTGQILWALVDGSGQDEINLRLSGVEYDLLAL